MYQIIEISEDDSLIEELENKSSGLFFPFFEEAGIERCFVAFSGDIAVGFQTVDVDDLCIAIEVFESWMGKGVSRALIQESGCNRPERNENPDFWEAAKYF